ncbi:uncharacterized protein PAC_00790 [Phialocephala subalpina]|uniref:Zn(2)-C6 fungal-type domain-containing protein n=1 Tax=Phialocephala subalpina TaxID=576137 RepID=A0A1L7WDQ0_9HELO|nr:uncharacterized protein PAC_00790 [Phialocephala subalpina]
MRFVTRSTVPFGSWILLVPVPNSIRIDQPDILYLFDLDWTRQLRQRLVLDESGRRWKLDWIFESESANRSLDATFLHWDELEKRLSSLGKLRKVKCDEKKPVCGKCAVHFSNITACDYASAPKPKAIARRRPITGPDVAAPPQDCRELHTEGNTAVPEATHVSCQLSDESSIPPSRLRRRSPRGPGRSSSEYDENVRSTGDCACPCHQPEYTHMMLDAILQICRICGNQPRPGKDISECSPILSDASLMSGKVDPFSILPAESSPRVHALMHHWTNTLALFPTKLHTQYCTNPSWMSQAINNETFFNATLYVSSVHDAGLRGQRETSEALYYKAQTIRRLNKSLRNTKEAVSDSSLAAVLLLTHIVSLIGEPDEAEIHMKGLQQMMALRGGVHHYTLDGVFLHMLCMYASLIPSKTLAHVNSVNHLTAVLTENPAIVPASGIPYKPRCPPHSTSTTYLPSSPSSDSSSNSNPARSPAETSPFLKLFATKIGFHPTVVNLLHEMEYLYFVVDAFTAKFMPEFREAFEDVVKNIETMCKLEGEGEKEWVLRRLMRWGEGDVLVRKTYKKGVYG